MWYPPNFYFEEYATLAEAEKAIIDLDGKYLVGQRIIAEYAKPKCKLGISDFTMKSILEE